MASFSLDIDPYAVLGVGRDASLQEIRDAYRAKTKKYHPDVGGEDWAFKILVQSYELLSTSRVMRAAAADSPRPAAAAGAGQSPRSRGPRFEPKSETVHAGIVDKDVDPARRLAVELLCVRYLWDEASFAWLDRKSSDEDRFLSCSVNVAWPDRHQGPLAIDPDEEAAILAAVGEIFDRLVLSTRAVSSRSFVGDDGFSGWLTYSGFDRAWKTVRQLQELLHARDLGIRQWSRDLFIPRERE